MNMITNESTIRLTAFLGLFVLFSLWEIAQPKRRLALAKSVRWAINLFFTALNTLSMRVAVPFTAASVAMYAQQHQLGLFNTFNVNSYIAVFISVVLLDMLIYFQHRLFHYVPLLWRMHSLHHSDGDIDVSTALRFHPLEILLSLFIKCAGVLVLGAPLLAVIMFEIILNGMAMFNHGNIRLPLAIDKILRLLLVTPDMHRVHHSQRHKEMNHNFGFNLSLWDKLFRTYTAQPQDGHQDMLIGLKNISTAQQQHLATLLLLDWKHRSDGHNNG